ncbi:MAG: NAD(P)H-quinone oxidoreductase [Gemmatimonadota bacterium]
MRAVTITKPGGPEVLEVSEVVAPIAGAQEILVRVKASAVNRADLLQRRGQYPAPPGYPQDIPGLEYAGVVEQVDTGVTRWQPNDRVMGLIGGGAYAEYVVVHEAEAMRVPAAWSLEEAAAVPEAFLTAHDALFTRMQLAAGETVLVHAIASGVGTAALQLVRAAGGHVIGTSRSSWKLEQLASQGLEFGIDVSKNDFADQVLRITNGAGVQGVLDLVGGDYLAGNLKSLATLGRIILVGLTAGRSTQIDLNAVLRKRVTITGTVMRTRSLAEKIATVRAFEADTREWMESGRIGPVIDRALPMDQAAAAHQLVEENANTGKVVLSW